MIKKYLYKCLRCGSTKTIIEDTERTGQPIQGAPSNELLCGVRGCNGKSPLQETGE